ncbi:MAG: tRNA (adenosine(37)-N6)-dimethylallyltransferase MiaA [Candidatus Moranbacteria bacterium]|nr:tRNA (adenosine(37)-N6)-dimethylallyltransferase MiaA [Candidatus Moranbacteria bacterium]
MEQPSTQPKPHRILAIVGPTASGKSSLAIELAKKYDGEIISADSRQIYRGMDIGTGKVTPEEQTLAKHHLIDIREPSEDYNVTDFKRDAATLIEDIQSRGKLPIICGGTLFWVQSLIDNQSFPAVPPNPKLRSELAPLSCEILFQKLQALDPKRAETIDAKNPIRLIRAIEIATAIGSVPALTQTKPNENYFIIALNPPKEILDANIKKRLEERFNEGMIDEVRNLNTQGISWERLEGFGLEYRWIALFLQGKIDEPAMKEKLRFNIIHYAKRQLTWLRRWEKQGVDIRWIRSASEIDLLF